MNPENNPGSLNPEKCDCGEMLLRTTLVLKTAHNGGGNVNEMCKRWVKNIRIRTTFPLHFRIRWRM